MGKVKQVIMGDVEAEEKARSKAAVKREQKKLREGEQVEEKTEAKIEKKPIKKITTETGKNYKAAAGKIDKNKTYSPADALKLIKEVAYANFDETVELHINVKEKGLRGSVTLPNGTGKVVRVKIADEALISAIEKGGKIDFDILVSSPDLMPKLAKIAKILGPRGLMPNPKTNTISPQPEKLVKDLSGGLIQYKTETDFPIIHTILGKLSFTEKKLLENYEVLLKAVGRDKVVSLFLKSTMSPAIRITV